jgi:hypothetical protein
MAAVAGTKAEKPAGTEEPKGIKPPEGYEDVGRPDIDGWAKPAEGTVIHGRICGFFAFNQIVKDRESPTGYRKQKREAVCLKVYGNGTRAFKKGDKDGFLLREGQVIAMSLNYALEPIREFVTKKGQAWIHFIRKDDIGGGQSVWKVDLKCKGERTAPVSAKLVAEETAAEPGDVEEDGDDSVPF